MARQLRKKMITRTAPLILLLLSLCLFLCCSSINSNTSELNSKQRQDVPDSIVDGKLFTMYFEMKNNPNSIVIDSAIALVDSMVYTYKSDDRVRFKYVLQKIQFLILDNRLDAAIDVVKSDSSAVWEEIGGPYYQEIIGYRLTAMSAKSRNNMNLYKSSIKGALMLVEKYIAENQKEYSVFLQSGLSLQKGKYYITSQEYVYYSFLLYGIEEADRRLREYQELYSIPDSTIEQLKLLYNMDVMDFFPI